MDELSEQYAGKVDFSTVDTGTPQGADLSGRFGISGLPSFVLLDARGEVVQFDEDSVKGQRITDDDSYREVYRTYLTSGLDRVGK